MSQQRLAESVGLEQPMISRIETGARRPSLADAALIARALATSLDDLLEL